MSLGFGGYFILERVAPDGTVLERARTRDLEPNLNPNVGLNYALGVSLGAGAQLASWFTFLINNTPAPVLAAADTSASHAGWSELTSYTEATRPAWTTTGASSQQITNSAAVIFSINASVTIGGLGLISNSTKGGTTGTIWAEALLDNALAYTSGETARAFHVSEALSV